MSDEINRPDPQDQTEPSYIPASPVKRTLAWIGVVYMVIVVALTTYIFFNGKALGNLGPLLTVPGLIGLGALALVAWRTGGGLKKWPAILAAVLCFAAAAFTLPIGIAGLMSNF